MSDLAAAEKGDFAAENPGLANGKPPGLANGNLEVFFGIFGNSRKSRNSRIFYEFRV